MLQDLCNSGTFGNPCGFNGISWCQPQSDSKWCHSMDSHATGIHLEPMLTSPRALDRRHARYMETGNPHAACPPRRRYCYAKSQWRCVFCFLMARIHSDSVGYSRGPFVRVVRVMAIQNRPGVYLVEVVPQPLRFGPGSPEDTCSISFVSPLAGVPHCLLLVQMPVKRPPWILPN